jgi:DNA-binding NarL/FixJ family response regulator
MSVRVLIADDQALVRAGFRKLLEAEEGIQIVAEASDGREAIELVNRFTADVVLMDIRMPTLDGLEATRRLLTTNRHTRVIILTTFDRDEYVFEAIAAGASGFLLKDSPPEELIAAIHVVARGEALLAPSITRRLIEEFARRPTPQKTSKLSNLTPRELDVLRMLAEGRDNADIAEALLVDEHKVKTVVGTILTKLQ